MFFSILIMRLFFLLLFSLMHYTTMVDSLKLINARAQEDDTLALPAEIALPDDIQLGGTSDINQPRESTWLSEQKSNSEPGLVQQSWIEDLPIAGSENSNCNSDAENSSDYPFTLRPPSARRRLTKRQNNNDFCPLPPQTSPAPNQQQQQLQEEEGSESNSPSPDFPKIPDIIVPGTVEPGRQRTTRKSNPLNEKNSLMLLYLYPGIDGKPNSAVCNRHLDRKVPICAPFQASRLSPAEFIKPCRLCEFSFFFSISSTPFLLFILDDLGGRDINIFSLKQPHKCRERKKKKKKTNSNNMI